MKHKHTTGFKKQNSTSEQSETESTSSMQSDSTVHTNPNEPNGYQMSSEQYYANPYYQNGSNYCAADVRNNIGGNFGRSYENMFGNNYNSYANNYNNCFDQYSANNYSSSNSYENKFNANLTNLDMSYESTPVMTLHYYPEPQAINIKNDGNNPVINPSSATLQNYPRQAEPPALNINNHGSNNPVINTDTLQYYPRPAEQPAINIKNHGNNPVINSSNDTLHYYPRPAEQSAMNNKCFQPTNENVFPFFGVGPSTFTENEEFISPVDTFYSFGNDILDL